MEIINNSKIEIHQKLYGDKCTNGIGVVKKREDLIFVNGELVYSETSCNYKIKSQSGLWHFEQWLLGQEKSPDSSKVSKQRGVKLRFFWKRFLQRFNL